MVEDSATQAPFLAKLMQDHGDSVRIAFNGREELLAAPAMIGSDIAVPEMAGFAMRKEIKKAAALRDIPVILLTSLSSLSDVIKGLDCGADNFISKQFDAIYLLNRTLFILANRAARSDERVQLGIEVNLAGQTHFITAERQQIFDSVISTYEEAIQMTEQIKAQQARTARSYQSFENLYKIAEALNSALTEQSVGELALDLLLDFPGVLGACIRLSSQEGELWSVTPRARAVDAHANCGGRRQRQVSIAPAIGTGTGTQGELCVLTADDVLSAGERNVVETVGNQIAVAVERARLYGHMEAQVKERTAAWQSERKLFLAVVNTTGALVCMVDAAGIIRLFNPACEGTMGWPAAEAIGQPVWEVFHAANGKAGLREFFDMQSRPPVPSQVRGEWLTRDGSVRSIIWSTIGLPGPDDSFEYFLGTGVDVTELRGAEEKLRYVSNFDTLTGLPNRTLMRDRVRQLQEKILASKQVLGYLLLKPERLGLVGESLGIEAEHAMLRQMAARLGQWSSGDTSVARVGEHAFALVAVGSADEMSTLARQVLAAMSMPFAYQEQELHLDPCIGIALFPNDGDDFDSIAQGAEAAIRRALSSKAERYEFYHPALNQGAHERFKFESGLRHALERDEFLLHYQPQISLVSGTIIGVEALVRWQHPELGLIAPGRFIGLAEETGLILAIGEWVLRHACKQSCAWQREGLPAVPVSVNLSAHQFSENIVVTVGRILSETGLEPRLLELELTESASMEDPKKTFEILRQLKDMGVQLAIDDFGTGYSNLSYLKRFPVDKLKLDQSFVKDITTDPDDLSIARAVIAMAHGLRLTVIAEGVETPGQLALLMENGCDEMQGYFFSRPVAADACARMLREGKTLALVELRREPYERTLLYVDDEVNLLSAFKRAMRHNACRILIASTAMEAFEILATVEVGVIVCDQRMPGMSGTEFLSRVKHMYPQVTRMVLSGYTDLQSVTDAVNHGAIFKFLTKPWNNNDLIAAVREGFDAFESKRATPRPGGRL